MKDDDRRRFLLGVDIGRLLGQLGIEATFNAQTSKWLAKCPNAQLGHNGEDHNPSWSIQDDIHSDAHGIHGCWSCGYSGHAVGLVWDVLNLNNWNEAVAWIQTHAMRGRSFAPLSISVEVIEPRLEVVQSVPEGVVPLARSSYKCRSYWLLKRHFTMFDATRWDIGGASNGECYDRIWIPLHNEAGKLVNWTARSVDDREPRYLRCTSSLNPDKGVLFGERFWPDYSNELVAISEGELNCIRIDSAFDIPVAGLGGGAKLDPTHAAKLSRFRRFIVFADGDKTGDRLTNRLRDLGKPMAVLRFSEGYEPCSVPLSDLIGHG